jgi:crotonobetainyl-CoA:carnitine CoA-transferase CaiB-like acyl-CoA transferase
VTWGGGGAADGRGATSDVTGPLDGIRVVDAAHVIAGPGAAARLGDFGADVIKIEHPRLGDPTRRMGWGVGPTALWWKWISRNKRPITLDLGNAEGQEIFLRLAETADVVVESFRPGTLERWSIGPDRLLARNPDLVILRISGFGQTGPYRRRPGFGTLAEAMSGFVHMNGQPDEPPLLPPIALADEVAALSGAYAVMVALFARERGVCAGQVIDASLTENLLHITGPIAAVFDQLGVVPGPSGSRLPYVAPRGVFRCSDGRWIAISGTTQSVAERLFAAIGAPDLARDPRFATNRDRLDNVDELERRIAAWIEQRPLTEVVETFDAHEVAAAPVMDIAMIVDDPHYRDRAALVRVDDAEMGSLLLPDVQPRLSATPGHLRHAGGDMGEANDEVYGELGFDEDDRSRLREQGIV